MYKKITKITLIMFMLSSCSNTVDSVKKGLTGAKNNSADEFLIKKKDPLILPPDFDSLPKPEDSVKMSREESIETEIDDILSSIKPNEISEDKVESLSENSSTEEFVLEQIKK